MGHINRTNEKYLVGWGNEEEERKERRKEGEGKKWGGKEARMLCDCVWVLRVGMLHRTLNW